MPRPNEGPYLADKPNAHGVWEIRWTEDGRSKRRSTGQTDRKQAARVLATAILASDEGRLDVDITIGRAIDAYLADKTDTAAPVTQHITFSYLKAHFGDIQVCELVERNVKEYMYARRLGKVGWMDAEGNLRGGRRAGPATMRKELLMLRTAIAYCVKKRKFKDIYARPLLTEAHIPSIDVPPTQPPRDRWLTRKEAIRFLAKCQPDGEERLTREYRFAAMALYTASRKRAIELLTWDRIDLERGLINFRLPGEILTRKRRGFVPIGAELKPILERAYRERKGNTPYYLDSPSEPRRGWERAAREAGLVDAKGKVTVSPHVLRHTFATWAAQDGVSLFDIAGILHDSIKTVETTYAHHQPEHLRRAVDRRILAAE